MYKCHLPTWNPPSIDPTLGNPDHVLSPKAASLSAAAPPPPFPHSVVFAVGGLFGNSGTILYNWLRVLVEQPNFPPDPS